MSDRATKRLNIKIPPWAPPGLCKFYKEKYTEEPESMETYLVGRWALFYWDENKRNMVERLLTQEKEMKSVWRELHKKTTKDDVGTLLLIMIGRARHKMRPPWARESRAQKRKHYLRIAKKAKSFANSLKDSELDLAGLPVGPQTSQRGALRTFLGSPISEFANDVAKEAESIARRTEDETPLLPRPNIANPDRVAFIRALAEQFVSEFGTPLYGTLANIASVCFDDHQISQETVKDALRAYPLN